MIYHFLLQNHGKASIPTDSDHALKGQTKCQAYKGLISLLEISPLYILLYFFTILIKFFLKF